MKAKGKRCGERRLSYAHISCWGLCSPTLASAHSPLPHKLCYSPEHPPGPTTGSLAVMLPGVKEELLLCMTNFMSWLPQQ